MPPMPPDVKTKPVPFGTGFADHIFSGASTPMSFRPFFSTTRVSSASFNRAACTAGSSPLMRQAL